MTAYAREAAQRRIAELAGRGLGLVPLWQEATDALSRAVPHFRYPCWYALDPASLLITSHFNDAMPELPEESMALEYYGDEVHSLVSVARSARGVSTLHEATGGDPSTTKRWQANMELGGDQELIAALRTPRGDVWGAVGLYREPGEATFSDAEAGLLRAIAPDLAEGVRRALLLADAQEGDGPDGPGLLVLSAKWDVESATPGVERWIDDLPRGDWNAGRLPTAVLSVAGRALRTAEGRDVPGEVAVARVLSHSGTWVLLHGAVLVGAGDAPRAAVIIEPAHPARIVPLLMDAYGLTAREQDVTRLVLQGESTAQIAAHLVVSVHTVQQHLKGIFEKTGVRSRRDLVGKVFFSFYEPRVRDNEHRALEGRPLRGGPMPAVRGDQAIAPRGGAGGGATF